MLRSRRCRLSLAAIGVPVPAGRRYVACDLLTSSRCIRPIAFGRVMPFACTRAVAFVMLPSFGSADEFEDPWVHTLQDSLRMPRPLFQERRAKCSMHRTIDVRSDDLLSLARAYSCRLSHLEDELRSCGMACHDMAELATILRQLGRWCATQSTTKTSCANAR